MPTLIIYGTEDYSRDEELGCFAISDRAAADRCADEMRDRGWRQVHIDVVWV